MYQGKEICQGCKKPGSEAPRGVKTDLCQNCREVFKKGQAEITYTNTEYVEVAQHYHAFSDSFGYNGESWDSGKLNSMVRQILESLDNPTVEVVERHVALKNQFGDNKYRYKVPKAIIEPLQNFALHMEKQISIISKEKEGLPEMAKKAVQEEKNRIYNEGISKGRDLLFSLNNGEITMDQFGENLRYKDES